MKYQPREMLAGEFLDAQGNPVEAEIIDLVTEKAILSFPIEVAPALALGQGVRLRFTEQWAQKSFTIEVRMLSRTEAEGRRQYEFEFQDPKAFWNGLSVELRQIYDKRVALRVRPEHAQPIQVSLAVEPGGHVIGGTVTDISVTGMAVLVKGEEKQPMIHADRVVLSFVLPPDKEALEIVAGVRHRTLVTGGCSYGIAFDAMSTESFAKLEGRLGRFVMRRQRERLVPNR